MSTWVHNISAYLWPMVISPIWLFISLSIFGQYLVCAGSGVAIIVVSYNSDALFHSFIYFLFLSFFHFRMCVCVCVCTLCS